MVEPLDHPKITLPEPGAGFELTGLHEPWVPHCCYTERPSPDRKVSTVSLHSAAPTLMNPALAELRA